jgi:hypothetical protein
MTAIQYPATGVYGFLWSAGSGQVFQIDLSSLFNGDVPMLHGSSMGL